MQKAQQALDAAIAESYGKRISPRLRDGGIINKSMEIDKQARTVGAVISTESVDRDQEIVVARGLDFEKFKTNPVVLFQHDPFYPIGKCIRGPSFRKRGGVTEVLGTTEFADTKLANEVYALVEGEFIRAVSIGMNPSTVEQTPPTPGEIRKKPQWAEARSIIRAAELIEYSFVSIPANADALTTAVSKGMIRETEPYFEPFIRAITDASSRKRIVRVVAPQPTVRVIRAPEKQRVAIANIDRDVRIKRALNAGRI